MQKSTFTIIILAILSACNSNSPSTGGSASTNDGVSGSEALYKRANEMGDDITAIVALNQMLLSDSGNLEYKDSLARLYLRNRKTEPGLKLGLEVLNTGKENNSLLELVSFAQEVSGEDEQALKGFTTLFEKTKDGKYKYEIAKIQYQSGDFGSANKTLDDIIKDKEIESQIEFLAQKGTQEVSIKAAAYFLKAQVAIDQNKSVDALNHLRQAVTISPNFEQAQYAIQQLQSIVAQQREQAELQRLQQKFGK
jgi:tetratricopeptide (TPR) repeat protein